MWCIGYLLSYFKVNIWIHVFEIIKENVRVIHSTYDNTKNTFYSIWYSIYLIILIIIR